MFESALAKIDRAEKLTNGLEIELLTARAEKTCFIRERFDTETGKKEASVHFYRDIPIEWAVIVGDIMHNLRSALDHAITDLTIAETGKPLKGTEFPIFDDEASYFATHTKEPHKGEPVRGSGLYKIRGVNDQARDIIRRLQPFEFNKQFPPRKPGQPGEASALSLIHELNIVDKHSTIHILRNIVTYYRLKQLRPIRPIDVEPGRLPTVLSAPVGEIKDGTKFF